MAVESQIPRRTAGPSSYPPVEDCAFPQSLAEESNPVSFDSSSKCVGETSLWPWLVKLKEAVGSRAGSGRLLILLESDYSLLFWAREALSEQGNR